MVEKNSRLKKVGFNVELRAEVYGHGKDGVEASNVVTWNHLAASMMSLM